MGIVEVPIERGELYLELLALLSRYPNLREFGLLISADPGDLAAPAEIAAETTDTIVLRIDQGAAVLIRENNLGISYWSIPIIYEQACAELKKAAAHFVEDGPSPLTVKAIIGASMVVVLISADNYTAWGLRKRALATQAERALFISELDLMDLVFSKHTKSPEAWAHRRWVLDHLEDLDAGKATRAVYHERYTRELAICKKTAELYKKNYYSWTHRMLMLPRLPLSLLFGHLKDVVDPFTNTNMSDNSGFHFRMALFVQISKSLSLNMSADAGRMLQECWPALNKVHVLVPDAVESSMSREDGIVDVLLYARGTSGQDLAGGIDGDYPLLCIMAALFQGEVLRCFNMNADYPGHEAIWMYMRALVPAVLGTLAACVRLKSRDAEVLDDATTKFCVEQEEYRLLNHEDTSLANHEMVVQFADSYLLWLASTVWRLQSVLPPETVSWAKSIVSKPIWEKSESRTMQILGALVKRMEATAD